MELVADVRAQEAVEGARRPAHDQRGEPVEDPDEEGRVAPEVEPDVVRDEERQTEEDGQPRAAQVVRLTDEVHGMRGRPRGGLEHRRRVAVRVAIGEEERVRAYLGAVADPIGAGVTEPARHPPGDERCEPAEKGADPGEQPAAPEVPAVAVRAAAAATGGETTDRDAEPAAEERTDDECRDPQDQPQQRLPPRLSLGLLRQDDVDRILARLAHEARIGVAEEVEVGAQVHRVADVPAEEAMEPAWRLPHEERGEPVEDPDDQRGDRPEDEPDVVRDREEQPEEDGEAVPVEVVIDDELDRMTVHGDIHGTSGRLRSWRSTRRQPNGSNSRSTPRPSTRRS